MLYQIMPLQGLIRVDKNLETNLDGIKLFFLFLCTMVLNLNTCFIIKKKKNLNTCI